jgi:hypothetical protein
VTNGGTGVVTSTGSGSVVLSTSPTLVTPLLGTPTSGNLANCTFPTLNQNTTGNAATATLATNATNATNATTAATVSTTVASGAVGTTQAYGTINTTIATTAFVQAALSFVYPVGCIYTTTVATNPGSVFGFGTWSTFGAGRVMIGAGGVYTAGATGGSADAVLVSHQHGGVTGGQNQNHVHFITSVNVITTGQSNTHTHQMDAFLGNLGGGGTAYVGDDSGGGSAGTRTTSVTSADHTHGVNGVTDANNVDHTHSIALEGVSATNANLQPYVVVYMWKRDS